MKCEELKKLSFSSGLYFVKSESEGERGESTLLIKKKKKKNLHAFGIKCEQTSTTQSK